MSTVPLWVEVVTAFLVLAASLLALIGSVGLLRLPTFFQRVHAPTLGATLGCWCMVLATIFYFSAKDGRLSLQALLICVFVALTTPITTIFLLRAARFRERRAGNASVPPNITRS